MVVGRSEAIAERPDQIAGQPAMTTEGNTMTGLEGHCGLDPQIEDSTMLASQSSAPSYTFTATTTDYESRFKLVFSAPEDGPSTGSGTFAFVSNGNIIVNGEGMLQVIDMTGRIVLSGDAINCVSTSGMVSGMYVLRLINGENVKTQKIVVR